MDQNNVPLSTLVNYMGLEIVKKSRNYDSLMITTKDLNRPGIQLTGFMQNFPWERIQIIGRVEYIYYQEMEPRMRYERFRGIFSYPIPALIYSYNQSISQDILDLADYYNKTVLRSPLPTTKLIAELDQALENLMAPRTTLHAELLEVFGTGVLIRGVSSVGKSETALDLVIRGHRLVADDVVDIKRVDRQLIGECPENIRYYMEIRGLGILDIRRLYGMGSVKQSTEVELVIDLEQWDEGKEYDRLGLDDQYTEILGIPLPLIEVPVRPGRNLSMIIEVATRNSRQKMMGFNAARDLNARLIEEANED